jgi:hypothetical protein
MKKYGVLIFVVLCALVFVSCANDGNSIEKVKDNDLSSIAGTYCFDYEGDTPELTEDHYIVIEMTDDKFSGYYYGTSDDFDPAREGYFPGFYVTQMSDLNVDISTIRFSIKLYPKDLFSSPVELQYKRSEDIPSSENSKWINGQIFDEKNGSMLVYEGKIEGQDILLNTDSGVRVFKKVKNNQ